MENQNQQPNESGKTFTQEDVNRIVGERLAKEKGKSEQELSKREQELARRELLLTAKETLTIKGLPVELLDALNCSDQETLNKSIDIIEKAYNEKPIPPVEIKGAQPADGYNPVSGEYRYDPIRQAMGLNR